MLRIHGFLMGVLAVSAAFTLQLDGSRPITLSAVHADYQDKVVVLDGDVVVGHELGKVYAQHVEVHSLPGEKRLTVGTMILRDKVSILLQDGGRLSSNAADIDCQEMTGIFSGNVIYTETRTAGQDEAASLIVKGMKMTLEMTKPDKEVDALSRCCVKLMTVDGDVNVNYNHDFLASADLAVYKRMSLSQETDGLPGMVTLSMASTGALCKVSNRSGDLIRAARMSINLDNKELTFDGVEGTLYGVRCGGEVNQQIDFSAGALVWKHQCNELVLQENVVVHQMGYGQLTSDDKVRIFQQTVEGKKQFKGLEAEGTTKVVIYETGKPSDCLLVSHGCVTIDHSSLLTTMESPRDEKGKVKDEDQVSFCDVQGDVFADRAFLYYAMADGKMELTSVKLEGNVRLKDRRSEDGNALHYIIADEVEFLPAAREMTFIGKAKRRVLFYDKINNVQVSAPALKIKRDGLTNKETIKGIGDVRFSFVDQEYAQLRNRFKSDLMEKP